MKCKWTGRKGSSKSENKLIISYQYETNDNTLSFSLSLLSLVVDKRSRLMKLLVRCLEDMGEKGRNFCFQSFHFISIQMPLETCLRSGRDSTINNCLILSQKFLLKSPEKSLKHSTTENKKKRIRAIAFRSMFDIINYVIKFHGDFLHFHNKKKVKNSSKLPVESSTTGSSFFLFSTQTNAINCIGTFKLKIKRHSHMSRKNQKCFQCLQKD